MVLEVDASQEQRQYVSRMRNRALLDKWADPVVALLFFVWMSVDLLHRANTPVHVVGGRGLVAALLLLMMLMLGFRRRAPVATLLTITAAFVLLSLLVTSVPDDPIEPFLALALAFYSVGAHCDERQAWGAGAGALAAIAAADLAQPGLFDPRGPRPGAWLVFAVAWLVGRDFRRRRQRVLELEDRAAQLEREREQDARRAVTEERARIARELHDVIAHGVSVIVVQAQAGPHLLDDPQRLAGIFGAIESAGREALVELRRLLGILRSEDEQLAIGPQPGLASMSSLVEQLRASGMRVELRVEGDPVRLAPGIDLAAYRIVQEALTNTIKHAGAAAVTVVIRYGTGVLELSVHDDGRAGTAQAAGGVNGSGQGLIGMRERVALYGGTLEVGALQTGGYSVEARFLLGEHE